MTTQHTHHDLSNSALLGEASHGTHEFYRERAEITKRLITEKGFTAVAVEADWPDAWRVKRYECGLSDDADADAALSGCQRFPAWMWRNTVVRDFVDWLRDYNTGLSLAQQFDAVIHFDETSALEPLDEGQVWSDREAPETFPSGVSHYCKEVR